MTPTLAGCRVVVTRAAHQSEALCDALEAVGARVVRLPLIEVVSIPSPELAQHDPTSFDWVVFASANAVTTLLERWPDAVRLPSTAVVGPATAAALRAAGHTPSLKASRRDGTGLASALVAAVGPGKQSDEPVSVLVPRADDARPELVQGLEAGGLNVTSIVTYGKRRPAPAREQALALGTDPVGWMTFTSPRIVEEWVALVEELGRSWRDERLGLLAASIGPTTSTALRRVGVEPWAEASSPGVDELVAALVAAETARRKS